MDAGGTENDKNRAASPLEGAGLFSLATYGYMTPLLRLGSRRPLTEEDLPELPPGDRSSLVGALLANAWEAERAARPGREKAYALASAVLSSSGWRWALAGAYWLVVSLGYVVLPLLVKELLRSLQKSDSDSQRAGWLWSAAIACTSALASVAQNGAFYLLTRVAGQGRSALLALMFRKTAALSNAARQATTSGKAVTLLTAETERAYQAVMHSHFLWISPLLAAVVLALLIYEVGSSALAGLALMGLLVPVQAAVGHRVAGARRLMSRHTDQRVHLESELLAGIRVVKMYAWEQAFAARVDEFRRSELVQLRRMLYFKGVNLALAFAWPVMSSLAIFSVFVANGGELSVPTVFTVMTLMSALRIPTSVFPTALANAAEGKVALQRIADFLLLEEMQKARPAVGPPRADSGSSAGLAAIEVRGCDFRWESGSEVPLLQVPRLTVPAGSLVAVVGPVGSGKSSLISALLGEMFVSPSRDGGPACVLEVRGRVAYASQQPWLRSATLRDNVVFGLVPEDEDRLGSSLDAAALLPDLAALPGGAGADTEIGERGINLSGGQKARVGLARALYRRDECSVFLLDDVLSSVDEHVAEHIFRHALQGVLAGRTRVVVMNSHLHFLPEFDRIVVVGPASAAPGESGYTGTIVAEGTYDDLKDRYGDLMRGSDNGGAAVSDRAAGHVGELAAPPPKNEPASSASSAPPDLPASRSRGTLVQKEERRTGAVPSAVVWRWLRVGSGLAVISVMAAAFVSSQVLRVASDWWLAEWSADVGGERSDGFWIASYSGFVAGALLLALARSLLFSDASIRSGVQLHEHTLAALLRAPVNLFFDVTPVGRVVNRLSADLDRVDQMLPDLLLDFFQNALAVVSALLVCCVTAPWFTVALVPISAVFLRVQRYFRASSRELKRLESVSRSFLYSFYGEVLSGVSTIRSYRMVGAFERRAEELIDANSRAKLVHGLVQRWIALRLDLLAVSVVVVVCSLAVGLRGSAPPQVVALSVVYCLQFVRGLQLTLRLMVSVEDQLTSVERLLHYGDVPSEAAYTCAAGAAPRDAGSETPAADEDRGLVASGDGAVASDANEPIEMDEKGAAGAPVAAAVSEPPPDWPREGRIEFRDLELRYRPGLELVLRGVSCRIPPRQKVGICGRTGAGKSSLMLALFRLVEAERPGSVWVDGVDARTLPLRDLRQAMCVIPQDPVMFSGTVRVNLDPFGQFKDAEIWRTLERVHLAEAVREMASAAGLQGDDAGLLVPVREYGSNFSHGQRQLLCIGRALMRTRLCRIVCIDEGTSSVDSATDELIQRTIREVFADCTVLTIAHRLDTLMFSDRILVMEAGRVVEDGTPAGLLDLPGGRFADMVSRTGPVTSQFLARAARGEISADEWRTAVGSLHLPPVESNRKFFI